MAKVPTGVKTLPKISTGWVGCPNVTYDRQTDGRQHYIERERSLKTCCWLLSVKTVPRLWRPSFLALPCHAQNHFTSYVYELRAIAISTISSSLLHRQLLLNASISVRDVLNYLSFYTSCTFLIQTRAPSAHARTHTHTHTHTHVPHTECRLGLLHDTQLVETLTW